MMPAPPGARLLEAPVTMVPVWKASARAVHRLAGLLPETAGKALLSRYRFVGAAGHPPGLVPPVFHAPGRLAPPAPGRPGPDDVPA